MPAQRQITLQDKCSVSILHMPMQLALAFMQYHLKREEPLYHLGHAGAFISRLHAGHDKGQQPILCITSIVTAIQLYTVISKSVLKQRA